MRLKSGSLCKGNAGLDLAVESLLDVEEVWYSELDPAPSQVCEVRYPGIPNLGDLTVIDWSRVEPVDVLTTGYPCQPFSQAGRRKGTDDHRHLWPYIADAIRVLRPSVVVLENVSGHLALGFDAVLGDLASLGFDAEWALVRASDVGACHRRERLFVVAVPSSAGAGRNPRAVPRAAEEGGRSRADVHPAVDAGEDAADTDGGRLEVGGEHDRRPVEPLLEASRGIDLDGLVEAASHAEDVGHERLRSSRGWGPRPADGCGPAPHTHGEGSQGREPAAGRDVPAWGGSWGDYAPAIRRHERVLGRPAPSPVDDQGRLSPRFVEWMMMLPAGWVTDVLTSRTKALKCLGNGVVPPQAAYAIAGLLERLDEREVAA